MNNSKYTAKNKSFKSHVEYAVKEIEKVRESARNSDGTYDISKITQRESRVAKNLQTELDRRVSLEADHPESIADETYRRYISYIKTCARNSAAKEPRAINRLISTCPNKTLLNLVLEFDRKDKKAAVKALESLKKKALRMSEAAKKETKKAEYKAFMEAVEACEAFPDIHMMKKIRFAGGMREKLQANQEIRLNAYQSKKNDRIFDFMKIHELTISLLGASTRSNLPEISSDGQRSVERGMWGVALGIALASGRRAYEIFYKSTFKALAKDKLLVTNLAKKRTDGASIEVPTLINAHDIEKAVKNLRKDPRVIRIAEKIESCKFDGLQNKIFSDLVSKSLSEIAALAGRGILKDGNKKAVDMRFKDARDIFAISAYENHLAQNGDLKLTRFVKEKLGHEDLATALSYEKFRSSDVVSSGDIERVRRLEIKKEKRAVKLRNLLKRKEFHASKPLIKCTEYVLQKLEEVGADQLRINTALLRKVDKGNGKIGALCKSEVITKFVNMIKAKNLDLPA